MKRLLLFALIAIIAFYILKAIGRLFGIVLNKKSNNRNSDKFKNAHQDFTRSSFDVKNKKRFNNSEGEYIDYEEVK